jgi:hypothetical protein
MIFIRWKDLNVNQGKQGPLKQNARGCRRLTGIDSAWRRSKPLDQNLAVGRLRPEQAAHDAGERRRLAAVFAGKPRNRASGHDFRRSLALELAEDHANASRGLLRWSKRRRRRATPRGGQRRIGALRRAPTGGTGHENIHKQPLRLSHLHANLRSSPTLKERRRPRRSKVAAP